MTEIADPPLANYLAADNDGPAAVGTPACRNGDGAAEPAAAAPTGWLRRLWADHFPTGVDEADEADEADEESDPPLAPELIAAAQVRAGPRRRRTSFSRTAVFALLVSLLLHAAVVVGAILLLRALSHLYTPPRVAFGWGDGAAETGLVDRPGAPDADPGPAGGGLPGPMVSNAAAGGPGHLIQGPPDADAAAEVPQTDAPPPAVDPPDPDELPPPQPMGPPKDAAKPDPVPVATRLPPRPPPVEPEPPAEPDPVDSQAVVLATPAPSQPAPPSTQPAEPAPAAETAAVTPPTTTHPSPTAEGPADATMASARSGPGGPSASVPAAGGTGTGAAPAGSGTADRGGGGGRGTGDHGGGATTGDGGTALTGRPGVPAGIKGGKLPRPVYPDVSRRRGEQGTVVVEVDVRADGRVDAVRVVNDAGYPRLAEAAVAAMRGAEFTPATEDGRPVPCTVPIPFRFMLR